MSRSFPGNNLVSFANIGLDVVLNNYTLPTYRARRILSLKRLLPSNGGELTVHLTSFIRKFVKSILTIRKMKLCPGTLYVASGTWSFDLVLLYDNDGHDNFGNRAQTKFVKVHNLQVTEGCSFLTFVCLLE
ncbi:hypothetical protein K443DRAFT_492850 [Laccaria amethystina LaAM-08-1]|uniref:Uncharacterized protein n=1 Tax=Laccaria amethystina LaAM-08-1 TaxID=1095629 RepID=A0A0C9X3W5_9AGAR|nr:hypothetical protein K443DRAFT_492850 [Laccaria amethystina LaAM-08-1]